VSNATNTTYRRRTDQRESTNQLLTSHEYASFDEWFTFASMRPPKRRLAAIRPSIARYETQIHESANEGLSAVVNGVTETQDLHERPTENPTAPNRYVHGARKTGISWAR